MRLRNKIIGVAATAAVLTTGALAAGGTVAKAENVGLIVLSGSAPVTCSSSSPIPAEPSCGGGIPYVGGSGSYTFSTSAFPPGAPGLCEEATTSYIGGCSVVSGGTYVNVVCGTGIAFGQYATVTPSPNVGAYDIAFAGGLGVFATTAISGSTAAAGVVDISPGASGGLSSCVTSFNVLAAIVAV